MGGEREAGVIVPKIHSLVEADTTLLPHRTKRAKLVEA